MIFTRVSFLVLSKFRTSPPNSDIKLALTYLAVTWLVAMLSTNEQTNNEQMNDDDLSWNPLLEEFRVLIETMQKLGRERDNYELIPIF